MEQRTPVITLKRSALAAALLAGTALGGFAIEQNARAQDTTAVNPPGQQVQQQTLPDFTNLVTKVKPAVVSITNKLQPAQASLEDDDGDDSGSHTRRNAERWRPEGPALLLVRMGTW
jgi:serine protease Do